MRLFFTIRTDGQATILVALLVGLGVLLGFVALAVDGGSALVQRRTMQNGADGAALGAAKALAASIVLSGGLATYSASNATVISNVTQLLTTNRGGTITTPDYGSKVEYGTFVSATSSYTYSVLATYSNNAWHYSSPYTAAALAPASADAVRVTAQENSPTVFAGLIGVASIPVQAKAASALQNVPNYVPKGPTWPMTRCAFPAATPPPGTGICNPMLFWSPNMNDPNCQGHGNFKSLMQLGEHQGSSYQGAHEQLLTQFDTRSAMTSVTGGNGCGGGALWSPAGNCTGTSTNPPAVYGDTCCSDNSSVPDIDIANWIVNDFQGTISLTRTWPLNYFRPNISPTPRPGDWLEVYNGGNLGNNISDRIRDAINARGTPDGLVGSYGIHLDKFMYLYDQEETWKVSGSNPNPQWYPTDPNESPNRVHMAQAFRFRFYLDMASTGGFSTPSDICGANTAFNTSNSKVYGVFAGGEVPDPGCQSPPCPTGHGLYDYVGYIDP